MKTHLEENHWSIQMEKQEICIGSGLSNPEILILVQNTFKEIFSLYWEINFYLRTIIIMRQKTFAVYYGKAMAPLTVLHFSHVLTLIRITILKSLRLLLLTTNY